MSNIGKLIENKKMIYLKQYQPAYKKSKGMPLGKVTVTEVNIFRSLLYDSIRENRFNYIGA